MLNHRFSNAVLLTALLAAYSQPAFSSQAVVTICCGPAGSISTILSGSSAISKTFYTPPGATSLTSTPSGSALYVATSSNAQNGIPGGSPSTIAELSTATGKVLKSIALPVSPENIVINSTGDHIFATAQDSNGAQKLLSVNLMNGQTNVGTLPGTPFDLYAIGISKDSSTIFVPVQNRLLEFSGFTLQQTGSITLGATVVAPPLATPDGTSLALATSTQVLS